MTSPIQEERAVPRSRGPAAVAAAGRPDRDGSPPIAAAVLYALLTVLLLAPLWRVAHVPTRDGPSHLYTAWLLGELATGAEPAVAASFEIQARPIPNWTAHAILALLLQGVSPDAAEKLLLSLYVLLFGAALWYLAGSEAAERAPAAFLALPLVYHRFVAEGFYNYCLGVALFAFVLGRGWRDLRAAEPRSLWPLHLLLLAAYFTHLVPHLLALAALAALWLARHRALDRPRRRWPLVLFGPQLLLPAWFVWRQQARPTGGAAFDPGALPGLLRFDLLAWGPQGTRPEPLLVAALFWLAFALSSAALVARLRQAGWRAAAEPGDAFLAVFLALVALALTAPDTGLGGSLVRARLLLLPPLAALPWLRLPDGRRARRLVLVLSAAATLGLLVGVDTWFRDLDRKLAPTFALLSEVPSGSSLLALPLAAGAAAAGIPVFAHAAERVAVERRLVQWATYEAASGVFPVTYRRGLERPTLLLVEGSPERLDLGRRPGPPEFVWVRGAVAPGSRLGESLKVLYREVRRQGEETLYRLALPGAGEGAANRPVTDPARPGTQRRPGGD